MGHLVQYHPIIVTVGWGSEITMTVSMKHFIYLEDFVLGLNT
jgi:hypothetical protein